MFLKRSATTLALFALPFLAGCATVNSASDSVKDLLSSGSSDAIKIESDPPGAEVFVMGKDMGATPLVISRKDVFPLTYPKDKEALYGTVSLKKSGCDDYAKPVSARMLDAGLKAALSCGEAKPAQHSATRPAPAHTMEDAQPAPTQAAAPGANDAAEQRLEKIKRLLDKGLINEDEAKKARERVLNDL